MVLLLESDACSIVKSVGQEKNEYVPPHPPLARPSAPPPKRRSLKRESKKMKMKMEACDYSGPLIAKK